MMKRAQFLPLGDENPTKGVNIVNWILIAINVFIFIFTLQNAEHFIRTYGFTPAEFSFLTIITSMFLHAGLAHLIGNMWFLYIFGDNVEDALGHFVYLILYLLSGVAATFAHLLLNINSTIPSVGASGAISGVLGAYLILFPSASVYVSGQGRVGKISAKTMIILWFAFQLISGTLSLFGQQGGIAFFAHIGGFVFGVAFALLYRSIRPVKSNLRSSPYSLSS